MLLSAIKTVWTYRGFVLGNVKREFQLKYQNSMLGAAWNVINPLSMIVVYTVIFSQIMRAKLPGVESTFGYSIYLCAGILSWGLFSEIVSKGQSTFIDNANLLKKINFPRLCLPVTILCNALLNFSIIFSLFSIFLAVSGNFPGIEFIAIIPLIVILIIFAIGIGITLGVLNVFFRDVGQFFGIALQFWFWGTPIIYPINILPEKFQTLISINPMAGVIGAFQSVLVRGEWPNWSSLLPALILGLLFMFIGMRLFRKHSGEIVDEL